MSVEIVSDKLLDFANKVDFRRNYHRDDVVIRTWLDFHENGGSSEVMVLDLDFSRHSNDSNIIPTLSQNRNKFKDIFSGLKDGIVPFLESGGTVIALLADRTTLFDLSNVDSLTWLDNLQTVTLVKPGNRENIEVMSEATPIKTYFENVQSYEIGIRFEDNIVTKPEIIAHNALDHEVVATSLNEYVDTNGIRREVDGQLTLLPQPTNLSSDFIGFIDSIVKIGEQDLTAEDGIKEERSDIDLHIPQEIFDEELISRCANHFENDEYQAAVQNAFITVEERLRRLGNLPNDLTGTELINETMNPQSGELTFREINAEKEGIMHLFRGGFLAFRNPTHHRFLENLDKVQAYNILCFANTLLIMLERNVDEEV